MCPGCGVGMVHNGYNVYRKQGLGCVKIGRYVCPCCGTGFEEERGFWERLKAGFFDIIDRLYMVLRDNAVSYEGISSVMGGCCFPVERILLPVRSTARLNGLLFRQ